MAGGGEDPTGVLNIVNKVVGVYSAFLIIVGTLGNLFLLVMCLVTPLRTTSTFVFLAIMAFADILSLYGWNLDHFIKPYFGIDRSPSGFFWCRVNTFLQFFSLSSSAWLLVLISFDRFMAIRVKKWSKSIMTYKRAGIVGTCLVVLMFLANLNMVFTFGVESFVNGTNITRFTCYTVNPQSKWMDIWRTVFAVMYSLMPFILIILLSLLLVYEIKKQTSSVQSESKRAKHRAMNRLVITLAISYIIFTLPGAVVTSILNKVLQEWGINGFVIINICDCLLFSYHAMNFLIVILTNKRFVGEVKIYFEKKFGIKFKSISNSSTEQKTQTTTKTTKTI